MIRVLLLFLALVWPASADTNVKPGQIFPPAGTIPTLTLTLGGTAQTLVAAQPASSPISCMFKNPGDATDQGIATAEKAYIRMDGTAATAAGGTASMTLDPGDVLTTGPQVKVISWIAATTGHKLEGFCWQ